MEIFTHWSALPVAPGASAVALGYFDGLHLGHQAVITAARSAAKKEGLSTAVFTFTRPPDTPKGMRLLTAEQKHALLASMGVDYCLEPPFEAFRHLEPRQFFDEVLVNGLNAKALACGEDFGFGARRAGTAETLAAMAAGRGLVLNVVPMAQYCGSPVSASRIKQALAGGEMEQAATMLGRPYEIDFPVQSGRHLGSRLGFPTINQIFPPDIQPPAYGVYVTKTLAGGRLWPSATGFGTRPTVDGGPPSCETFIPGFEGDLYGQQVRVQFFKQIDTPRKFASLQQLAEAVQGWAAQARHYFGDSG